MPKLRIAMVGLGDIAKKAYLPIIASHPAISPMLCTRNSQVLSELQQAYRIDEVFTDYAQLLENKPDALMIHSSTDSHYQLAKASISAGIATFIDKPLSYNFNQCEHLIALAKSHNVPLYVGFNRRFAPLISAIDRQAALHIRWQKNRVALADDPRVVIFDDFIHVVDSLRFLCGSPTVAKLDDIGVHATMQHGKLAHVKLQFNYNGILVEGSMNRLSGIAEEQLEIFLPNQKYLINNLTQGQLYNQGKPSPLGFNDWQSYLHTRGFISMIEDWLIAIKKGSANHPQLDDMLASHQLCEHITQQVEAKTH